MAPGSQMSQPLPYQDLGLLKVPGLLKLKGEFCSGQTFNLALRNLFSSLLSTHTHTHNHKVFPRNWMKQKNQIYFCSWILFPQHLSPSHLAGQFSPQILWDQIQSYHFHSTFSSLLKIKLPEATAAGASLFPEWHVLVHLKAFCLPAKDAVQWLLGFQNDFMSPDQNLCSLAIDLIYDVDLSAQNTTLLLGRLETFKHW